MEDGSISHIETSPTSRARCRLCGEVIFQDTVRVAIPRRGAWGLYNTFYHAECIPKDMVEFTPPDTLPGYCALCDADREVVRQLFQPPSSTLTAVVPPPPPLPSLSPPTLLLASSSATHASPEHQDDPQDAEALLAESEQLLMSLNLQVVGIRHYRGVAHPGEYVNLVREPDNPYDANAVRVDNMSAIQVGHIKRAAAAALAPLMDDGDARLAYRLEAHIPGRGNQFQLPCLLSIYGLPDALPYLQQWALRKGAYSLVTQPHLALPASTSAAPQAEAPQTTVHAYDRQRSQAELEQLFSEMVDEEQSRLSFKQPDSLLTPLQPHQERGVAWMIQRETSPDGESGLPPYWELRKEQGREVYYNTVTNSSHSARPQSVKGGLLADEMGLGKTLHVLALIVAHPAEGLQQAVVDTSRAGPSGAAAMTGNERSGMRRPEYGRPALGKLRKLKLVDICRSLSLNTAGTRPALIGRIVEAVATATAVPSTSATAVSSPPSRAPAQKVPSPRGTLIVVPLSVIYNWETQINLHFAPGTVTVHVYHGPNRTQDLEFLQSRDIVITTYQVLASELSESSFASGSKPAAGRKRKLASQRVNLYSLSWRRVVLDEAHSIRNRATASHRAACAVQATYRWCLTGTPMQNSVADVQALLGFLRCSPMDDFGIFNRAVGRPIRNGDPLGVARLKVAMKTVCLRRVKKDVASNLPPKTMELHTVTLDPHSQQIYDSLYQAARHVVISTMQVEGGSATVMTMYAQILECLLRLRQACLATELIPESRVQAAREVLKRAEARARREPNKPITLDEAKALFDKLKGIVDPGDLSSDDPAECCICLEEVQQQEARILRTCKHFFCFTCLRRLTVMDGKSSNKCPLCRQRFCWSDAVGLKELEGIASFGNESHELEQSLVTDKSPPAVAAAAVVPPKVVALLAAVQGMMASDPTHKAVVFSSFTGFLDVLARNFEAHGIQFCRIDGRMSNAARQQQLGNFADSADARVMLLSLKAGGVGLNLTMADHVFLTDLWWNVGAEEQAIDRVHRIGQTRPVKVVRYMCRDTIEGRILEIQERKAATSRALLNRRSPEETRQERLEDLRTMFGA